jgi:hypothetical protein
MNTKPCKCKSGLTGWCGLLRDQYQNFVEFVHYAETYGLAGRLGFDSAEAAWEANPVVEGSVNPADFRVRCERYRLVLPSGSSSRGAQMGRRNILPAAQPATIKLHLIRLKWADGDYDQWGAYWGNSGRTSIFAAVSETIFPWISNWDGSTVSDPHRVEIYVRAINRADAKCSVRKTLAGTAVKFYR